jgi:outer membrane murein-binding lipoprotein Lpp
MSQAFWGFHGMDTKTLRNWVFIGCALWLAAAFAGCRNEIRTPWDNLRETEKKNTELSLQVQSLQKENEQLKQQVQTLSELDKNARLTELDTLTAIRVHRRTAIYDKNDDGTPETLVVYLQTLDSQQDQVKTAGRCVIQLWNLGKPESEAKLAEWSLTPADLQGTWGGNIFAQYYRLSLPLETLPPAGQELTVRVVFTDLLTGKVLTDQFSFTR